MSNLQWDLISSIYLYDKVLAGIKVMTALSQFNYEASIIIPYSI